MSESEINTHVLTLFIAIMVGGYFKNKWLPKVYVMCLFHWFNFPHFLPLILVWWPIIYYFFSFRPLCMISVEELFQGTIPYLIFFHTSETITSPIYSMHPVNAIHNLVWQSMDPVFLKPLRKNTGQCTWIFLK